VIRVKSVSAMQGADTFAADCGGSRPVLSGNLRIYGIEDLYPQHGTVSQVSSRISCKASSAPAVNAAIG